METRCPPGLYLEPPDFEIELDAFGRLPLCRLEAFRLLRDGQATKTSDEKRMEQKVLTADARLLLLHGHGDRPSEAEHRRADLASHFILKLACCGGSSSTSSTSTSDGSRSGGGVADGLQGGTGSNKEDQGEEEADRRKSRREWHVRAERDLFEARLHWHLRQAEGAAQRQQQEQRDGVTEARGAGKHRSGDCNGAAAAAKHVKREVSTEASRCEALRIVYNLGWLQPVAAGCNVLERTAQGELQHTSAGGSGESGFCGGGGGAARKRRRDGDEPFREEKDTFPPPPRLPPPPGAPDSSGTMVRYTSCPFQKALPLIRSRQALLRDGRALLSPAQVPEVVVGHFEGLLRDGLAVAARGLPLVEADERVAEVLQQVRRAVDAVVYGGGGGGRSERSAVVMTRSNIDQVAENHFPLCMRRALRVLRREHHLKYQARLQLISFLGNAGMEVREVLALWREEFPKGMPAEEYSRKKNQYEYSLRHLYGLEGKRKAYSSQSCARIASLGGGGSGEGGYGHGCPFHLHPKVPGGGSGGGGCSNPANNTSVRGMLAVQNLPAADIEDIVAPLETRSGGGGALGACRRHFSATHRWEVAGGGVWKTGGQGMQEASPNGWLAASTASSLPLPPQEQEGEHPAGGGKAGFLTQEGHGV